MRWDEIWVIRTPFCVVWANIDVKCASNETNVSWRQVATQHRGQRQRQRRRQRWPLTPSQAATHWRRPSRPGSAAAVWSRCRRGPTRDERRRRRRSRPGSTPAAVRPRRRAHRTRAVERDDVQAATSMFARATVTGELFTEPSTSPTATQHAANR